jgi:hypothetical protein
MPGAGCGGGVVRARAVLELRLVAITLAMCARIQHLTQLYYFRRLIFKTYPPVGG